MRHPAAAALLPTALSCLAVLLPPVAWAAWPSDPAVNVALCGASGEQYFPAIVADGSGGAIVTWSDARDDAGDIYVQHVSASGQPLWGANGLPVCVAANDQSNPTIVSDGAGGAIIAWNDRRGGSKYDIYAQRISAGGVALWTGGGVALCTAGGHQQFPVLTSDGAHGAIVAWFGLFLGNYDIYAQRVSDTGTPLWTPDGVPVCTAAGHQEAPTIVGDGSGGAIVTWFDQRTGSDYTHSDIYAQRLSDTGATQWTGDGVALCTAGGPQQYPTITTDGAHGAIVTWYDGRDGNYDIYAQRVSSAGAAAWTPDGVPLCVAPGEQAVPTIASDAAGGAFVSWRDYRSGFEYDIYAQRISGSGAPLWTPARGVAVCTADGDQYDPAIVADGTGGAILAWPDLRNGLDLDIYAQRLSAGGLAQWTPDGGVAVSTAAGHQNVTAVASDDAGGAIVTWRDKRGAIDYDIYSQRVKANGALGEYVAAVPVGAPSELALGPMGPNPAHHGALRVSFSLPGDAPASLEMFDTGGRRIAVREVGRFGAGTHSIELGAAGQIAPGLYFLRLRQGANARMTRVVVLE